MVHRVSLVLLCLLVILAPLPVGGSQQWAWTGGGLLIACLGLLTGIRLFSQRRVLAGNALVYTLLSGLCLLSALQFLPLGQLLKQISPLARQHWLAAQTLGATVTAQSISLVPGDTASNFRLALLFLLAYFLLSNVFTTRHSLLALALALAGAATCNALLGIVTQFSTERQLFWYLRQATRSPAICGSFLNKNHFALLLEMGLPVSVGIALATAFSQPKNSRKKDRFRQFFRDHYAPLTLGASCMVMVLLVALLFSFSRAGTFCALATLIVFAACALRKARRNPRLIGLFLAVSSALVVVGGRGLSNVWNRYEDVIAGDNLSGRVRWEIWRHSLDLLGDYWRAGVGSGAYKFVSPIYEPGIAPDKLAYHAHNDWLELLCEFGLPIGLLISLALILLLVHTGWRLYRQPETSLKWLGAGGFFALLAVAAHEFFDYGLRHPGNMLACLGCFALAHACGTRSKTARARRGAGAKVGTTPPRTHETSDSPIAQGSSVASASALPSSRLPRSPLHLAAATLAVFAAILLVAPLRSSRALTHLQARTAPSAPPSMMNQTAEMQYRLELTDQILRHSPTDSLALYQAAESTAILAVCRLKEAEAEILSNRLARKITVEDLDMPDLRHLRSTALREVSPELRHQVADALADSVAKFRVLCGQTPTQGHYLALFGRAMERAGIFNRQVPETELSAIFDRAGQLFPRVGTISLLRAEAEWRKWRRLQRAADSAQAEAQLETALARFADALEQTPKSAGQIYPLLWDEYLDPDTLRAVTPDYLIAHSALYRFFFEQRELEECLRELQIMTRLNDARVPDSELSERPPYEVARRDPRSKTELGVYLQRQNILLLGLLERWSERDQAFAQLQTAQKLASEEQLASAQSLFEAGQYARTRVLMRQILELDPLQPQALILQARTLQSLGLESDAIELLLRLVYTTDPVSAGTLQAALPLAREPIAPPHLSSALPPFPVWRFLRSGLRVKLACLGTPPDPALLDQALAELKLLDAMLARQEVAGWLQTPTLHYLIGTGLEALQKPQQAQNAYQQALTLCPTHLPSSTALARLQTPEVGGQKSKVGDQRTEVGGQKSETAAHPTSHIPLPTSHIPLPTSHIPLSTSHIPLPTSDVATATVAAATVAAATVPTSTTTPASQPHSNVPTGTTFGGKLRLLRYSVTPRHIAPGGFVSITFVWQCLADMDRDYTISCQFLQGSQHIFSDNFRFQDCGTDMVTWRVGEVITITRQIAPAHLAASQNRRRILPGWVDLQLVPYAGGIRAHRLAPPVQCRVPAFEVASAFQTAEANP
jgi:tetratricopeptide (TPR) repeat protein